MRRKRVAPVEGYDRWAATYDNQPDNVVLALESSVFTALIERIAIQHTIVVDIGCGTGRHWPEILSSGPSKLIGVDASSAMLERLKLRYPSAQIIQANADDLAGIADASCDTVISTLALAHLPEASRAIAEWSRMLRRGGNMIITDFHPDAMRAGMKRTFVDEGHTVEIESYVTELVDLREIASNSGLTVTCTLERAIDENVRPLYERAQYLDAYDKHKGQRLVFGMHLTKP